MELFKLLGTIAVDNDDANRAIDETTKKAGGFGNFMTKAGDISKAVGAACTVAMGAAATAVGGLVSSAMTATDRVDKLSKKMGLSPDGFQEFQYAAKRSGMEVGTMQRGMKTLIERMDQCRDGNSDVATAFATLGVAVTNSDGTLRNSEEVMWDVITALAGVENPAERARLASQLFGEAGSQMAPMLDAGADGIQNMRDRAHDLGLVLTQDMIDKGVLLGDTFADVGDSLKAAGDKIGTAFFPGLQKLGDWAVEKMPTLHAKVEEWMPKIQAAFTGFVESILPGLEEGFNWIMDNAETIATAIGIITTAWLVAQLAAHPLLTTIMAIVGYLSGINDLGKEGNKLLTTHTQEDLQVLQDYIDTTNELRKYEGMEDYLTWPQRQERDALIAKQSELWGAIPQDMWSQYQAFYGGANGIYENGDLRPIPVELANSVSSGQQPAEETNAELLSVVKNAPFMSMQFSSDDIVTALGTLGTTMDQVAANTGRSPTIVLNTGALVGGLAPGLDSRFGADSRYNLRGN